MSIRAALDDLAKAVITKAKADSLPLDSMVEALKVCATYYAICEKVKVQSGEGDGGSTFADFHREINGATHQKELPHGRPAKPSPGGRGN